MENIAYLLKLTQPELKGVLYNYLKQKNMSPISDDGFLYAEGDIPVLVVAHMDTVFDEPPKNLRYNRNEDKIYNLFDGLGGDDRCGIYAIIQLLEKFRPYVLFTEDEEKGCIGATKAVEKLYKPNVKYIIEFDRRGKDDCVFYDCGNEKFMDYIESFGFKTNYGTCSDISILGSAWDIASVNLSSGYYNEHTEKEYVIFGELQKTISRAKSMLKALKKAPYFDYQEIVYKPRPYSSIFDFDDDMTDEEWILWFDRMFGSKTSSTNTYKVSEEQKIPQEEVSSSGIKRLLLTKNNKLKKDKNGENNGNE